MFSCQTPEGKQAHENVLVQEKHLEMRKYKNSLCLSFDKHGNTDSIETQAKFIQYYGVKAVAWYDSVDIVLTKQIIEADKKDSIELENIKKSLK